MAKKGFSNPAKGKKFVSPPNQGRAATTTSDYEHAKTKYLQEGSVEKVPAKRKDIVNKEYVDNKVNNLSDEYVNETGDTMSGNLHMQGNKTTYTGSNNKTFELGKFQNSNEGISIRAQNNPTNNIFGVESSGGSTRFGVQQSGGTWATDGFYIGEYNNSKASRNANYYLNDSGEMKCSKEQVSTRTNHSYDNSDNSKKRDYEVFQSNQTLDNSIHSALIDVSQGNISITLPFADDVDGRMYYLKLRGRDAEGASENAVEIQVEGEGGGARIEEQSTYILDSNKAGVIIQAFPERGWYIFGSH